MVFFARPETFLSFFAAILILVLFLLAFWEIRKIKKTERELILSYPGIVKKVFLKSVLSFFILMFLAVLLAEPYPWDKTREGEASSLIFVIDATKSMQARDSIEALSRLERSKEIAVRILSDIRSVDVGVCVFGAIANCLIPISELTHDKRILEAVIEDFVVSGNSYGKGSDVIGSLEDIARTIKEQYPDSENFPMVVVFTDGEQTARFDSSEAIDYLRKSGIKFVFVGVGEKEGAKIPIFSAQDRDGKFLIIYETFMGEDYISFLKEEYLRDLARRIGGEYFFENDRGNLAEFVKVRLPRFTRLDQDEKVRKENILHLSLMSLVAVLFIVFTKKYIL